MTVYSPNYAKSFGSGYYDDHTNHEKTVGVLQPNRLAGIKVRRFAPKAYIAFLSAVIIGEAMMSSLFGNNGGILHGKSTKLVLFSFLKVSH